MNKLIFHLFLLSQADSSLKSRPCKHSQSRSRCHRLHRHTPAPGSIASLSNPALPTPTERPAQPRHPHAASAPVAGHRPALGRQHSIRPAPQSLTSRHRRASCAHCPPGSDFRPRTEDSPGSESELPRRPGNDNNTNTEPREELSGSRCSRTPLATPQPDPAPAEVGIAHGSYRSCLAQQLSGGYALLIVIAVYILVPFPHKTLSWPRPYSS